MKKYPIYGVSVGCFLLTNVLSMNIAAAAENKENFVPAYQNADSYQLEDISKYKVRDGERVYYTSGKKNGFRVNENNEESTDLTIGILTFPLAPAAIVYMNVMNWWD